MNYRVALSCALLATTLAACSTLHSRESDSSTGAGAPAGNRAAAASAAEQALLSQRAVHFDYDQTTVVAEDQAVLKAHASYLGRHPKAHVRLTGHTDERGTTEYNMALGEYRAKTVQTYLTAQGVKASQLDVVSFGKEKPLDADQNEAAWAKNRRVEFIYQNEAP